MKQSKKFIIAFLVLICLCVAADFKIYRLYGQYQEGVAIESKRVTKIAKEIETDITKYKPTQISKLLNLACERELEMYLLKISVWLTIVMSNIAILASLIGAIFGYRAGKLKCNPAS